MLTAYRPQFVENILTDGYGRRFKVVFAVSYGPGGEVRGRIVSVTPIQALNGSVSHSHTEICLPCARALTESSTLNLQFSIDFVSPYFSNEFLINSQPTRAPSAR